MSIHLQIWYLDFCPWWFLSPYYWRRYHSSGPLWPKGHSAIVMWSSPPFLSFSTQIEHHSLCEVKLLKPNSWNCFITTEAQFVPWVCILFLQLKPSETHNKFGPRGFLVLTIVWRMVTSWEQHWTTTHNLKCLWSFEDPMQVTGRYSFSTSNL